MFANILLAWKSIPGTRTSQNRFQSLDGALEIADGPFIEGKEVLAGYFLVEADNYDHAVELARNTPHLEYGTVEIHEVEFEWKASNIGPNSSS